jgi:hypothetical protein
MLIKIKDKKRNRMDYFIENSRKTSSFRAGMDSVATASGLF